MTTEKVSYDFFVDCPHCGEEMAWHMRLAICASEEEVTEDDIFIGETPPICPYCQRGFLAECSHRITKG